MYQSCVQAQQPAASVSSGWSIHIESRFTLPTATIFYVPTAIPSILSEKNGRHPKLRGTLSTSCAELRSQAVYTRILLHVLVNCCCFDLCLLLLFIVVHLPPEMFHFINEHSGYLVPTNYEQTCSLVHILPVQRAVTCVHHRLIYQS